MKNEFTENILREWLNVFKKNYDLITDMPSISENFIGFIRNQHDQSALSLLLKKMDYSIKKFYRPLKIGILQKKVLK